MSAKLITGIEYLNYIVPTRKSCKCCRWDICHPLWNDCWDYIRNTDSLSYNNICIGYKLMSNHLIIHPRFDSKREQLFINARNDILEFAKIYTTMCREHLYKQELMNIQFTNISKESIPEDVIRYILKFVWDAELLA